MTANEERGDAYEGPEETQQGAPAPVKRKHRATYSTDKKKGGYLIRVSGPYPERFAGKDVPVTTRAGGEHTEKLTRLIWTGPDKETGEQVALYAFEPKPREREELDF